jgi:hypothetical protein
MIIRINELKLRPDHTKEDLEREIRKVLHLQDEPLQYEIMRQSIDARKKPELFYVYTVDVTAAQPEKVLKKSRNKKAVLVDKKEYTFPSVQRCAAATDKIPIMNDRVVFTEQPSIRKDGTASDSMPDTTADNASEKNIADANKSGTPAKNLSPVIVGSGPSGLFCALMLARSGLRPIVLERGEAVDDRMETVSRFWKDGILNPESNVQFGEGGAGTFSDGKLNTSIKDPEGKIRFVLKEFVKAGADPSILYHHKPHIGTDVLVNVVKNIRNEILSLGGTFCFQSCLTGIVRSTEDADNCIYHLEINGEKDALQTKQLVLAVGHSARDTFYMLYELGLPMQAKSFAVGFRMEHSQQMINDAMYGEGCPYEMGAAPYKVTHKCENGRGVYSFCMCPGGYVVNASSEEGMTAVNGMSYSGRDSANANSAIVVTVTPEDYQAQHPLSGIEFQRKLERAAYKCGEGKIPVQRFEDFCAQRATTAAGTIAPVCKGQYRFADLNPILPEELNASIIEGIRGFGRRIRGFDDPDALLSGIESRTSSPVRITRDEECQTIWRGIYPCGEGAGYAGGITSAAVDGIRVAEAVIKKLI